MRGFTESAAVCHCCIPRGCPRTVDSDSCLAHDVPAMAWFRTLSAYICCKATSERRLIGSARARSCVHVLLHDRNDSDVPGRIVLSNILGQNRSHAENRSHGHNRSHENERSLAPKPKYVQNVS